MAGRPWSNAGLDDRRAWLDELSLAEKVAATV